MALWKKNLLLGICVLVLVLIPIMFVDGEYGGADGEAEGIIAEIAPEYEPWVAPIIEPLSGEIESLLFCLQAAIGGGIIGYALGVYRERHKKENKT